MSSGQDRNPVPRRQYEHMNIIIGLFSRCFNAHSCYGRFSTTASCFCRQIQPKSCTIRVLIHSLEESPTRCAETVHASHQVCRITRGFRGNSVSVCASSTFYVAGVVSAAGAVSGWLGRRHAESRVDERSECFAL